MFGNGIKQDIQQIKEQLDRIENRQKMTDLHLAMLSRLIRAMEAQVHDNKTISRDELAVRRHIQTEKD